MRTRETLKRLALATGLYRPGRLLQRHVLDRGGDLARFRQDVAFFGRHIEPGALCFDVGANIGRKTEALLVAGAKVVAFEPQPDCMAELRALCRPYKGLITEQTALGSEAGTASLHVREYHGLSGFQDDWIGGVIDTIEVSVTTLDEAIARHGVPAYCKIDVEGWEHEVVRGLSRPIPLLSFEHHDTPENLQRTEAVIEHLRGLADVRFNVTAAEVLALRWEDWLPANEFLAVLRGDDRHRMPDEYGDVFVRMSQPD